MGIPGLTSYMKDRCVGGVEKVYISELAKQYREEMKKDPVMLVDLPSCIQSFATKNSENTTAYGEVKKLKKNLEIFLIKCYDMGIKLRVYFDGMKSKAKCETWSKKIEMDLRGNPSTTQTNYRVHAGALFSVAILVVLSSEKCEWARATYEADNEIIHYAKKYGCFAILTADSDFFLVEGARYCLSSEDIDLHDMTTCNFNRNNLAKNLKISPSQLALFGSFCMCSKKLFLSNKKIKYYSVARQVRYVTKKKTAEPTFWNPRDDFKQWMEFYEGFERPLVLHSDSEVWKNVLVLAEQRHVTGISESRILQLILNRSLFLRPKLTDIMNPSPVSALLSLRKNIYGIIFFECPEATVTITEHSFVWSSTGPKYDVSQISFIRHFHRGLCELWSSDRSKEAKHLRLKLFCLAIHENLTREILDELDCPEEVLLPVLAVFYLRWVLKAKLKPHETKTILMGSVLANKSIDLAVDWTDVGVESFYLANWFLTICEHFLVLNSVCGYPFCRFKTSFENFYDYKIFSLLLKEAENFNSEKLKDIGCAEVWDGYQDLEDKVDRLAKRCGLKEDEEKEKDEERKRMRERMIKREK